MGNLYDKYYCNRNGCINWFVCRSPLGEITKVIIDVVAMIHLILSGFQLYAICTRREMAFVTFRFIMNLSIFMLGWLGVLFSISMEAMY